MGLSQRILLCCVCLAAYTRPQSEHSYVSLPYFVREPTETSEKTIQEACLLRRGSSNLYYYSKFMRNSLPLQCLAFAADSLSNKSIEYSWTLNNVEVTKWRGKTSITLENADLSSHIAKYRCVASLRDLATGKTRSIYSSELTLLPPPDYPTVSGHPLPNEGRCLRNSYLVINSSCYMEPIPYIHWNNVENLFRNGDAYMTATSALVIKCNALSRVLDISSNCLNNLFRFIKGDNYLVKKVADSSINPIQPESVDYPVQYLTYSVGDFTNIACRSALFFQNPKQVKFYKNNPNNELEEVAARRPFKLFFQLNVTLEDAGEYTCEVTLSNGTKFRDETRLTVLAPPYWIRKPPTVVYINDGESLYLDYEVGGSPMPNRLNHVVRRGNGKAVENSEVVFTTKSYEYSHEHRRGESYSLELRFANDQADLSTSVSVIVVKPFQFSPIDNQVSIIKDELQGNKLVLTCVAEFDSLFQPPQVKWTYDIDEASVRSVNDQAVVNDKFTSKLEISLAGKFNSTPIELEAWNHDVMQVYVCSFSAFYGNISKNIEVVSDHFSLNQQSSKKDGLATQDSTRYPTKPPEVSLLILFVIVSLFLVALVTGLSLFSCIVNVPNPDQLAMPQEIDDQQYYEDLFVSPCYWRLSTVPKDLSVMRNASEKNPDYFYGRAISD